MSAGMAGIIAAHHGYRFEFEAEQENAVTCDCGQPMVLGDHAAHVAEELAKAGYGDVRDAPRAVHYAGNVGQAGYTGRPEGWTSAQWHESAWGDTGEGYSLPGRLYVVQCAWCPAVFMAHTKKEAVALYRRHETDVLDGRPTTSPTPARDAREELAREVFVADNARQSRTQSLADWDMLTNSKSPGDQLHTRYAYAIAEGLLARGVRIDPTTEPKKESAL